MGPCKSKPIVAGSTPSGGKVARHSDPALRGGSARAVEGAAAAAKATKGTGSSKATENHFAAPSNVSATRKGQQPDPHGLIPSNGSKQKASPGRDLKTRQGGSGSKWGKKKSDNDVGKDRSAAMPTSKAANISSAEVALAQSNAHAKQRMHQRWSDLYLGYKSRIIDPADIHSVLDERISSTIDQLSPSELTMVQRRVREVVRSTLANDGSGATMSSTMAKMGRLVGATAGVDSTADDNKSKSIYLKENVIDENLVRKIFAGGERWLRSGLEQGVPGMTRDSYLQRRPHQSASSGLVGGSRSVQAPVVLGQTLVEGGKASEEDSIGNSRNSKHGLTTRHSKQNGSKHPPSSHGGNDLVDPIGSAYLLMMHFSENRWDHVALIARIAAEQAGLTLDVNKLAKQKEEGTKGDNSAGPSAVPRPPPRTPTGDAYGDDLIQTAPGIQSGVRLKEICFIVAMALGGTRRQRLNLLFYLLLPPKQLKDMLSSHPAGGLPTWLLEIDSEVILSYASLSHYFYCGGVIPPSTGGDSPFLEANLRDTQSFQSEQQRRRPLSVDPACVFNMVAVLLSDALDLHEDYCAAGFPKGVDTRADEKASTRQNGSSNVFRGGPDRDKEGRNSITGAQAGASAAISDYSGNCFDLANYLLEMREGKLASLGNDTDAPRDMGSTDDFWAKTLAHEGSHSWSLHDFVKWADVALDDRSLDVVMHRLFGRGNLPTASMERDLIRQRWMHWQFNECQFWAGQSEMADRTHPNQTSSFRRFFRMAGQGDGEIGDADCGKPFGGLGGSDGKGGLGYGVLYVVDKMWWEEWVEYSGWEWAGDGRSGSLKRRRRRPHEMSTEHLLDRSSDALVAGTQGFYEEMKSDLRKGRDYVLIPPAVWDLLFELYGGGPPIPRMVLPPSDATTGAAVMTVEGRPLAEDGAPSVEVIASQSSMFPSVDMPVKIPGEINVATHPWVLHCHVCDHLQPYRRGDAGPISIRVMVSPDQPLWRVFAEIVARLPISNPKARSSSGRGKARLWKRVDPPNVKDSLTGAGRYGPWVLLCKSRSAEFPVRDGITDSFEYDDLKEEWQSYADHGSVESVGLSDGMRVMFEYAVNGKGGVLTWPREAAAKAGRMRRFAEEENAFRSMLQGLDSSGNVVQRPSPLVGKVVDAMDASGRWYPAEILQVDNRPEGSEEDGAEDTNVDSSTTSSESGSNTEGRRKRNRLVKVDFSSHGGHEEWIEVNSDRLAVAGRFTVESIKQMDVDSQAGDDNEGGPSDNKGRLSAANKLKKETASAESSSTDPNSNAVCPFPGYGACGLTNLGNTCYANSALQCIGYIPLLRSYLLSGQYKIYGDLNKDNPLGTGGKLLEEYADLLRVMWSGKYGIRAPSRFRGQLGKALSQYSGADQQDAQELLNDMLDVLHEDSNKVKKKPYVEALEDDWVKKTDLPRVGQEAWRRFLRRNRSIVAEVAMGQVLNTVTCPVCNHSSRNFDPFNMLSIPFPTVAEVVFRCTVVRRGTVFNCPATLGKRKSKVEKNNASDEGRKREKAPPSNELIFEQYIIPMSRLADIGDLKLRLQNISGIPSSRFKLCKAEDIVVNSQTDKSIPTRTYVKVSALPDKEGPCVQLAKQTPTNDNVSSPAIVPTQIVAFEITLNPRPPLDIKRTADIEEEDNVGEGGSSGNSTTDEDLSDEVSSEEGPQRQKNMHERILKEHFELYGDKQECVLYDTDPTPLSKAMSRSLWPRSPAEFKLGLRVDAIDHRDHWFPGSIVEIIEGVDDNARESDDYPDQEPPVKTKVRIHFDNFSSKWDETYSIDHFREGQVRPLYSHATPRARPTEFLVHHRHLNSATKGIALFGQAFYLQCQNEWSTARAGAHILAQASRFLQQPPTTSETMQISGIALDEARSVISQVVDILIKSDRQYLEAALSYGETFKKRQEEKGTVPRFNASAMSSVLSKKLSALLPLLPFDVRVCTADSPLGGHHGKSSDEVAFPFSLVRTIGNYMNARHAIVLHWRDRTPSGKKDMGAGGTRMSHILYVPPNVAIHEQSRALLNSGQASAANKSGTPPKRKPSAVHGGINLGVCLTEFCKEQQLPAADCWRCPHCKEVREGKQSMTLWRLPDILTFHIKRFNCSARWREKITTRVNFPLTGLDMSEWCDSESPARHKSENTYVYDLIGVVNHYGGMTGGHYVATCKATACSADGSEEVAYSFNGAGATESDEDMKAVRTGWRLPVGRSKDKEATTSQTKAAAAAARAAAESAEPLWLQFDDDLVEPIPPRNVVSEMAYVLFYRRRRMSPSNIAKYCTLE